jgi:hypothetical protein
MRKRLGKFQINRRLLILMDRESKRLLRKKIFSNVKILVTDIDDNLTYHFIGESDLFLPVRIGRGSIPSYDITIVTDTNGYFIDFKFALQR